jgi:hypothetical protein
LVPSERPKYSLIFRDFLQCSIQKSRTAGSADEIVKPVQELLSIFRSAGYRIVFLTMRPARFRPQTEAWLAAHGVAYDELLMAADTRPDAEQKRSMYEEFLHPRYDVRFVIDDRASVVAMWREMGLMVLDVAGADF